MSGSIAVIGIGPGDLAHMTPAARHAIESADVIVGYVTYLRLIEDLAPDVPRKSSGMRKEVDRITWAVDHARAGERVAVVSSGDAGIYGMAGLVYEVLQERNLQQITVEVIPGVTALSAAAALLGAPLMTDFAVISLSDQLIPRADILKRVELTAQGDFILGLYNPKGKNRTEAFDQTCEILARYRAADTPIGIVRAATRDGQQITITTLDNLREAAIDMLTIIIVGNSRTTIVDGKLVTLRGYGDKYQLGKQTGSEEKS